MGGYQGHKKNITKKSRNNINSIQLNNRGIADPPIIASEFNNHFTMIAKQIKAKLVTLKIVFQNLLKKL